MSLSLTGETFNSKVAKNKGLLFAEEEKDDKNKE